MTATIEQAPKKSPIKLPLLGMMNDFTFWTPSWWRRWPEWLRVAIFLILVTAWSTHERAAFLTGQYWMDEAITVGISSHPLTQIPGLLRYDGAPPLFYMLLHVWMGWFGNSPKSTHWLSLIFASLTIPAGYWGGVTIANKRAGLMTASLFAVIAFLDDYSTETRMYSLMCLLGLLATIGFVNGFVYRRRKYIALFVIAQALMFYTHAWASFYCVAAFLALVFLYFTAEKGAERKGLLKDGLIAFVIACGVFLPWVPTFLFQSAHTAAPWAPRPRFGAVVQIPEGVIGSLALGWMMFAVAVVGFWGYITDRVARQSREAKAMYVLVALAFFTLFTAWCASQINPAFVLRYFAPAIGPIILVLAYGMSRAGVLGALALVATLYSLHHPSRYASPNKSNMQDISAEMGQYLNPGDLVIVGQPEQVPLAYYYLPGGLQFSSTIGMQRDPTYMDWINAMQRFDNADPWKILPKELAALKPGQQVLFIRPLTEGNANWDQPWTREIRRRSAEWGAIIADDKQLVEERWAPHYYQGACCVADAAVLYKKV